MGSKGKLGTILLDFERETPRQASYKSQQLLCGEELSKREGKKP